MSDQRRIIFNGTVQAADRPLLPAESRAVWYGDGCFETFRSYSGKFLKPEAHLERLRGGLEYLGIKPPFDDSAGELCNRIIPLLEQNQLRDSDAVVRLQVWREGGRGFDATDAAGSGYSISVLPMPDIPPSVGLAGVSIPRIPSEVLDSRFKLSNSLNLIRAATEAAQKGADDALMCSTGNYVSETTIANIFWLKDGVVFTPSRSCDILPGITRSMIIEMIRDRTDVTLEEGKFQMEEVRSADAAWICNSVREWVPVHDVDGQEFSVTHPFFEWLQSAFESFRNRLLL